MAKRVNPWAESKTVFRVYEDEQDGGKCKLTQSPITRVTCYKVFYKLPNGEVRERTVAELLFLNAGTTEEEALEKYLEHYRMRADNAADELKRIAKSFYYHDTNLISAKFRIAELRKELER